MDSVLDGISGETTIHYFRDGLLTKYADILISKNIRTDEAIFLPGIRLIVTLLGKTELRFSDKMFCLTAEKYPAAGLLSISKEISGSKYFSGKKQQELVIFLEEEWLKSSGFNQCMDYAFLQKIQKSNLEFIPAFRVGYLRDDATDGRTFVSPIDSAIPYFRKSLKAVSELDLSITLHTFPQKIQQHDFCVVRQLLQRVFAHPPPPHHRSSATIPHCQCPAFRTFEPAD